LINGEHISNYTEELTSIGQEEDICDAEGDMSHDFHADESKGENTAACYEDIGTDIDQPEDEGNNTGRVSLSGEDEYIIEIKMEDNTEQSTLTEGDSGGTTMHRDEKDSMVLNFGDKSETLALTGTDRPSLETVNPTIEAQKHDHALESENRHKRTIYHEGRHLQIDMGTHSCAKLIECDVFTCDECGKVYRHRSNLMRHKKSHRNAAPYTCDICEKIVTERGTLNRHKKIHSIENDYIFDICQRAFSDERYLNKHKKKDTGYAPLQCEIRGKAFCLGRELDCHKKVHTGEKPYRCGLCHKAFSKRAILNNHKKIHTGETPYKCNAL
jgi:hypothetical protein